LETCQRHSQQGNALMILDETKNALELNRRIHLEMDEIEELLELARKTDPRLWCVLTLAFNHGLRPTCLRRTVQFTEVTQRLLTWSIGSPNGFYQRPVGVIFAIFAAVVRPQKHSGSDRAMRMRDTTRG
jgi:hypothetical protein